MIFGIQVAVDAEGGHQWSTRLVLRTLDGVSIPRSFSIHDEVTPSRLFFNHGLLPPTPVKVLLCFAEPESTFLITESHSLDTHKFSQVHATPPLSAAPTTAFSIQPQTAILHHH